jgi:ATP-dependent DNA ligase
MRFFAFDWMSLTDWNAKNCATLQLQRTTSLEAMILNLGLTKIIKSKSKILNSLAEATAFYTEVIELGLPGQDEGLIIKDLNGKYEWNSKKRTFTWAKWKPVIDVDVKIVGFYYGSKDTKNEFRLGGFNVEGEDENGNKIKSNCGGFKVNSKKFKDWIAKFDKDHNLGMEECYNKGMSKDEFFRSLAVNRFEDLFKGATCTIETQELSKAENSETFSLRFPQFIMLRDDK